MDWRKEDSVSMPNRAFRGMTPLDPDHGCIDHEANSALPDHNTHQFWRVDPWDVSFTLLWCVASLRANRAELD